MADGPRVVSGVAGLAATDGRLAVAVGVFDGIHRGHRHLLRRLVRQARAWSARAAVITFDAHPDEVLRGAAPPLLLDPDERLLRMAREGIEIVVVEHFDDRLRTTPYDEFVAGISARVDLAGFVMTPDAAFGFERRGTPDALAQLGRSADHGFDVAVVPPFTLEGRPVSSSAIRTAIGAGDLGDARHLLGRPHAVIGTVAQESPRRLTFAMPVALPPAGRYRVSVVAFPPGHATIARAIAEVRDGALTLGNRASMSGAGRVRVAFGSAGTAKTV